MKVTTCYGCEELRKGIKDMSRVSDLIEWRRKMDDHWREEHKTPWAWSGREPNDA